MSQFVSDLMRRFGSATIVIACGAVFIAVALAGVSMTSRLGGAGWLIYIVVMTAFGLLFGPLLAHAYNMRKKASPKARAERDARIEADRIKYRVTVPREDPDAPRKRRR